VRLPGRRRAFADDERIGRKRLTYHRSSTVRPASVVPAVQ
jgi:hypothetical protein